MKMKILKCWTHMQDQFGSAVYIPIHKIECLVEHELSAGRDFEIEVRVAGKRGPYHARLSEVLKYFEEIRPGEVSWRFCLENGIDPEKRN